MKRFVKSKLLREQATKKETKGARKKRERVVREKQREQQREADRALHRRRSVLKSYFDEWRGMLKPVVAKKKKKKKKEMKHKPSLEKLLEAYDTADTGGAAAAADTDEVVAAAVVDGAAKRAPVGLSVEEKAARDKEKRRLRNQRKKANRRAKELAAKENVGPAPARVTSLARQISECSIQSADLAPPVAPLMRRGLSFLESDGDGEFAVAPLDSRNDVTSMYADFGYAKKSDDEIVSFDFRPFVSGKPRTGGFDFGPFVPGEPRTGGFDFTFDKTSTDHK